jgi:HAD superfamily hydrolase (TIGR01509 family)
MLPRLDWLARRYWIFDMDGTLTVAVHDFDAIREELGLPEGRPILEELEALPAAESAPLYRQLDEIELELARSARAEAGARELLEALRESGRPLGILTRNSLPNALETLRACDLERFFDPACVLGRDEAAPKPDPDGIRRLLRKWSARPEEGLMIGDFLFDLMAGRAAGLGTVYFDRTGAFPFAAHADVQVRGLDELRAGLEAVMS